MKKVSALLAALVLSVAAYAQASGGFINPANNAIVSAPSATNVVASPDGSFVTVTTPQGTYVLEPTAEAGKFRVKHSTVNGIDPGFITQQVPGVVTTTVVGGVTTTYALAGLGVVLVVTNTPNKGTTISGTTGSV